MSLSVVITGVNLCARVRCMPHSTPLSDRAAPVARMPIDAPVQRRLLRC